MADQRETLAFDEPRLVMLLTGNNSIKEVILFPSMKNVQPGEEEATEGTMQEKLGTI